MKRMAVFSLFLLGACLAQDWPADPPVEPPIYTPEPTQAPVQPAASLDKSKYISTLDLPPSGSVEFKFDFPVRVYVSCDRSNEQYDRQVYIRTGASNQVISLFDASSRQSINGGLAKAPAFTMSMDAVQIQNSNFGSFAGAHPAIIYMERDDSTSLVVEAPVVSQTVSVPGGKTLTVLAPNAHVKASNWMIGNKSVIDVVTGGRGELGFNMETASSALYTMSGPNHHPELEIPFLSPIITFSQRESSEPWTVLIQATEFDPNPHPSLVEGAMMLAMSAGYPDARLAKNAARSQKIEYRMQHRKWVMMYVDVSVGAGSGSWLKVVATADSKSGVETKTWTIDKTERSKMINFLASNLTINYHRGDMDNEIGYKVTFATAASAALSYLLLPLLVVTAYFH